MLTSMTFIEKLRSFIDDPKWFLRIIVARKISFIYYKWVFKTFGKNSTILSPIRITPRFIHIGQNVFIWPNCRIEGVSYYLKTRYYPIIEISDNVSIQQNLHLTCSGYIHIGTNTALAANVTITDINHPYTDVLKAPENQELKVGTVSIESDCKIYNNVVILPGVHIGKHTIVGANSIVPAGKYPDFCVLAGNPARIIKRYCFETKEWLKTDQFGNFLTN